MSGNRNIYIPTRRSGKYVCVPGARNEDSDSDDEEHPQCQVVYQPCPQSRPHIPQLPPRSNIIVFPPVNTYIFNSNQGGSSNTATGATGATGAGTDSGPGSGETGSTGITGAPGTKISTGNGLPTINGRIDDLYIDNTTSKMYKYMYQESEVSTVASLNGTFCIAIDSSNNIYVSSNGHKITKIDTLGNQTLFAGSLSESGYLDGDALNARFRNIQGMCFDSQDNMYLCDTNNKIIRKIDTSGNVTTVAGTPGETAFADGPLLSAKFNLPVQITVGLSDTILFISDSGDNRIRKVDLSSLTVSTYAGTGIAGYSGDNNLAINATLIQPQGIVMDSYGNVYFSDNGNSAIRKIDTSGIITTFATQGIQLPFLLSIDSSDNIYEVNYLAVSINKIDTSGNVSLFAGSTPGYLDGPVSIATFTNIFGTAVDSSGNVYVCDDGSNLIRKITINNSLQWVELLDLQGPTGATGANGGGEGVTGPTGSSGSRILVGSGDPNYNSFSTIGYLGDFYIDLTNGILYGPRN